jgi:hypothetical protein
MGKLSLTFRLWDNLSNSQIMEILNKYIDQQGVVNNIEEASKDIANEAERLSNDIKYNSPFAKKAKENKMRYYGGKPDDITVVVAQFFSRENEIKHHNGL